MFLDKKLLELCIHDNGVPCSRLQNVQNAGLSYPMAINAHRKMPKAAAHKYVHMKRRSDGHRQGCRRSLTTRALASFSELPGSLQMTRRVHEKRDKRTRHATRPHVQKSHGSYHHICSERKEVVQYTPATALVDHTHFTITKACNVDRFSSFYKQEN